VEAIAVEVRQKLGGDAPTHLYILKIGEIVKDVEVEAGNHVFKEPSGLFKKKA